MLEVKRVNEVQCGGGAFDFAYGDSAIQRPAVGASASSWSYSATI